MYEDEKQNNFGTYGSSSYSNYDFGQNTSTKENTRNNENPTESINYYGSVPPLNQSENGRKEKKAKKSGKAGAVFRKFLLAASLGLFFGLCAGIGFQAVDTLMEREESANVSNPLTDETTSGAGVAVKENSSGEVERTNNTINAVTTDVSDVVEEVMPAMVSIMNSYTQNIQYFGRTISQEGQASGSGIIIGENDTELLVVTNYHVVEGAETITVSLIDGTEAEAQIKGTNSDRDLAVIAIALEDLSAETKSSIAIAALGDSDSLKLGEPAIAIGNALGYGQSVTTGVISGLNREIQVSGSTIGQGNSGTLIQTNAAINPGNSGGALLNLKGEVIGINSNKIGETTVEGMGYAIPISAVESIISDLMLQETRTKVSDDEVGYMGVTLLTVTEEVSELYGMPRGIYISEVVAGSPAEQAGIVKGDIVTKIGGTTVQTDVEMKNAMQYYAAGSTVEITIQHGTVTGYEEKVITVELVSRETINK